jgi:hypothetical protein
MARTFTTRSPAGGVGIPGFDKAVKELRSFDPKAAKAVARGLRKASVMVQATARSWMHRQRRPRTPTAARAVGRFANQKGAGITLRARKYPWAVPMEYGGETAFLWGKIRRQKDLRSRQFRPWVGNVKARSPLANDDGYVYQRAIWEDRRRIAERLADDVLGELANHIGGRIV